MLALLSLPLASEFPCVNLISDLSQCPLVSRKYIIAEYLSYHSKEERNKQKAKKNSKILILQIFQNKIV